MTFDRPAHWDQRYAKVGYRNVSWFSPEPRTSLALLARTGVGRDGSIVDVGAGASLLVDRLVDAGYTDLTLVDVSAVALDAATDRLPDDATAVIVVDVLKWEPGRQWDVWHERAMFHFVNTDADIEHYRQLVARSVVPGGHAVIGTFSDLGPLTCSGLPVARYTLEGLAAVFEDDFDLVWSEHETHITPTGSAQEFSWVVLRRHGG
ncbi:MAG: class I SAM-dependent methyltransferase [Actinomycetes bacterium]